MNTQFFLFKGFTKVGEFDSFELAENAINSQGIWNICEAQLLNGQYKIINRTPIRK